MGIDDITGVEEGNSYKRYPSHEWDDRIEQWANEAQSLFPGGVEYDFIEVSPEMTRTHGFAYTKTENGYIRISEQVIKHQSEDYVRLVLLHELTHLWFHQNGYSKYSDNSGIFEWVLGRIGADINGVGPHSEEFEIITQFLEHQQE